MSSSRLLQAKLLKKKYDAGIFPILQEKRTRSFATLAFTLISLSLFGVFAINPTISTIIQLRKQLADNQDVSQKLEEKIGNLSVLQQKYDTLQPDLPFAFVAIPSKHEVPLLIGQIQQLASENGIEIVGVQQPTLNFDQLDKLQQSSLIAFTIDARGPEPNAFRFVNALMDFERVVTIESITLSKTSATSGDVQLNIKANAYFKSM